MAKILAKNIKATQKVAQDLAGTLGGGEVIALTGNLGAGKTVFVKALAQSLGVKHTITSPTFVLLKVYDTRHRTIKKLVHVDCYRLVAKDDFAAIGLEDYLEQSNTVVVVEWADKISHWPARTIRVSLKYIDDKQREITVS